MKLKSASVYSCMLALTALNIGACKARTFNKTGDDVQNVKDPNPNQERDDPNWIYNGKLPMLQNPRLILSLRAHTLRVVGFIPSGFDVSQIPSYARVEQISGKNRLTVVYPVATVDKKNVKDDGTHSTNVEPKIYEDILVAPYTPFGAGGPANQSTPWGGFPYLEYNHDRNIAFHGPITSFGGLWTLLRGPVSHACNRMQGEHVVELTHLIGVDMTKPYPESKDFIMDVSVRVIEESKYDVIEDGNWAGKTVDVDYPAEQEVILPEKNVEMFKTWNSQEHPEWMCAFRQSRANKGMQQCADLAGNGGESKKPPTDKKPNAKICNVKEFANVRNSSLSENPIGKGVLDEKVIRTGKLKTAGDGREFEELFFLKSASGPEGFGFVLRTLVCDL